MHIGGVYWKLQIQFLLSYIIMYIYICIYIARDSLIQKQGKASLVLMKVVIRRS